MSVSVAAIQGARRARLPETLDAILRQTSRSIYLTLRVLPRPVRRQLMLGYLFCRAADTIADTRALPPERRLEALARYRAQFESPAPDPLALREIAALVESARAGGALEGRPASSAAEAALLRGLEDCFAILADLDDGDRALMRRLLVTLTRGMEIDLETFPPEERATAAGEVAALETDADLDRYCYHVAGCVGEFWTDLQAAHLPALAGLDHERMRSLGVRFGKGLQMTNVLRDLPADLRIGRCYLPRRRLEERGLRPGDLRRAAVAGEGVDDAAARATPVIDDLLDLTLEHYRAGREYTLALPRRLPRLRLACAWPLLIGLETLAELRARTRDLVAGARLKVARGRVYALLASSACRVLSDGGLSRLWDSLESKAGR